MLPSTLPPTAHWKQAWTLSPSSVSPSRGVNQRARRTLPSWRRSEIFTVEKGKHKVVILASYRFDYTPTIFLASTSLDLRHDPASSRPSPDLDRRIVGFWAHGDGNNHGPLAWMGANVEGRPIILDAYWFTHVGGTLTHIFIPPLSAPRYPIPKWSLDSICDLFYRSGTLVFHRPL
jgi:hypothetical protein